MNKNPFVPQPPPYTQQPPLPPGPPPQGGQPDYSAYWAAQQHQPPTVGTFNGQWTAPQQVAASRPPADQSALYANYGYGNQQQHWQRPQGHNTGQQHFPQPPPSTGQGPPAQPAYNPYQPQAAFHQSYTPQQIPIPHTLFQPQQQLQPLQQQQQQQMHFPQPPQQPQQLAGQRRQNHPPQSQPPAKRPRFDGPNQLRPPQAPMNQPPPPQFAAPPPPPLPQAPQSMQLGRQSSSFNAGRNSSSANLGRGGSTRNARGGTTNRGGGLAVARGGRGGGSMYNNTGRGGSFGGGHPNAPLRGHHSQTNFPQHRQHQNRRGGMMNTSGSGHHHHQHQNSSFRGGRQGGQSFSNRRHDHAGSIHANGTRSVNHNNKRTDNNKRTFADFKIVGLEIRSLEWKWGAIPSSPTKLDKDIHLEPPLAVKKEEGADVIPDSSSNVSKAEGEVANVSAKDEVVNGNASSSTTPSSVPSRLRIYFHTPVTAEDSRPISHIPTSPAADLRKGKRKKIEEEEDGDIEDGRGEPRPRASRDGEDALEGELAHAHERASVAPSVATEAASDHDWLMAGIGDEHGGDDAPMREAPFAVGDGTSHSVVEEAGDRDGELLVSVLPEDCASSGENGIDGDAIADMSFLDGSEGRETQQGDECNQSQLDQTQAEDGDYSVQETQPEFLESDEPALEARTVEGGDTISLPGPLGDDLDMHGDPSASSGDAEALNLETAKVVNSPSSIAPANHTGSGEGPADGGSVRTADVDPVADVDSSMEDGKVAHGDSSESRGGKQIAHPPEPVAVAAEDDVLTSSKADIQPGKMSANRLSISYAGGSRRLVINADVVEKLKVFRSNGKIEVILNLDGDYMPGTCGVLVEGLSTTTKSYRAVEQLGSPDDMSSDFTIPPFARSYTPCTLILVAYLDHDRPLSEARWLKTGDVEDWLKSEFGDAYPLSGGWEKKIDVVDPDPPPTIQTLIEGWATSTGVGSLDERERFVKLHMSERDNIFEILLRLVRGERATAVSSLPSSMPLNSLLSGLKQGFEHGAQQTQISLAVLGIMRMAGEYAERALGDKGRADVDERVGELIRSVPHHLLHKALDGMFKEWKAAKKGMKR